MYLKDIHEIDTNNTYIKYIYSTIEIHTCDRYKKNILKIDT